MDRGGLLENGLVARRLGSCHSMPKVLFGDLKLVAGTKGPQIGPLCHRPIVNTTRLAKQWTNIHPSIFREWGWGAAPNAWEANFLLLEAASGRDAKVFWMIISRCAAGKLEPLQVIFGQDSEGLQRIDVVNHSNTRSKNQSQEPGTSKLLERGHFDLILTILSRKAVKHHVKVMKHSEEVTTCHHQNFRRLVLLGLNMIKKNVRTWECWTSGKSEQSQSGFRNERLRGWTKLCVQWYIVSTKLSMDQWVYSLLLFPLYIMLHEMELANHRGYSRAQYGEGNDARWLQAKKMQKGKAKQRANTEGTQLICEDCNWRKRVVHVQPPGKHLSICGMLVHNETPNSSFSKTETV